MVVEDRERFGYTEENGKERIVEGAGDSRL